LTLISLIVLAAGTSSRLGAPKQLLRLGGVSLVRRAVSAAVASGLGEVIVVLGPEPSAVAAELTGLPWRAVTNPEPDRGMGLSLRAGLAAVDGSASGAIVMVCDQPAVDATLLRRLADAWRGRADAVAAACAYGGSVGVPALFSRRLFPELLAIDNSAGAKRVLLRHEARLVRVPFPAGERDIDTPRDLNGLS
jgi:molybdenum cofactor cytidylyltransferase